MNKNIFKRRKRGQAAFTLVEMIIVLIIIGLLAGFAIYNLTDFMSLGKTTKAEGDIVGLRTSLSIYQLKNHSLPTAEQGLNALVTRPSAEPVPDHWQQTMDSLVMDPWGHPYQYRCPGKHNPTSFDIFSMGPDGLPDTADDIGNWKEKESATTGQ